MLVYLLCPAFCLPPFCPPVSSDLVLLCICLTRCLLQETSASLELSFLPKRSCVPCGQLPYLLSCFSLFFCSSRALAASLTYPQPFPFFAARATGLFRQFLFFKPPGVWFYSSSDRTPFLISRIRSWRFSNIPLKFPFQ